MNQKVQVLIVATAVLVSPAAGASTLSFAAAESIASQQAQAFASLAAGGVREEHVRRDAAPRAATQDIGRLSVDTMSPLCAKCSLY